jgi:hypothetical protein
MMKLISFNYRTLHEKPIMCLKLYNKYRTCCCTAQPWLLRCGNVQRYLRENCPYGFRVCIRNISRRRLRAQHVEEELETGGDDWDYKGGLSDNEDDYNKSPAGETREWCTGKCYGRWNKRLVTKNKKLLPSETLSHMGDLNILWMISGKGIEHNLQGCP